VDGPAASVRETLQQPAARLPWGHHMVLLDKLSEPDARLWTRSDAAEHGSARKVLEAQMASDLRARHGAALTTSSARCRRQTPSLSATPSIQGPVQLRVPEPLRGRQGADLEQALLNDVQNFLMVGTR
jgi:predicted nuclease of restriction endonuclease-like (RecB) superfamily